MSRARCGVVAGLLCFTLSPVLFGQQPPAAPAASVPRVVRVDGQFVPANGLPLEAAEVVTLLIYSSQSSETPLWEETQQVRPDAQGRFAVFLGAASAEGLPIGLFAPGEPRWLGMRFSRPGEAEQARVRLTSVPYALRASDADTLGGLPPSAFLRADGTKRGAESTAADGNAPASARSVTPNISSGTANYIGKFVDSVDLTSSALFQSGVRIGLGTTTPLDFLHSQFTDTSGSLTGLAVQNLGSGSASYSGMLFYDQNGALGQFQGFNNSSHEYRINNIASGGSINFMLSSVSRFQVRNDGDIEMAGSIRKGTTLFLHNRGTRNTGAGLFALYQVSSGTDNTAVGEAAQAAMTTGSQNVSMGRTSLFAGNGNENTAVGYASFLNSPGNNNIGLGAHTGQFQVSGDANMYLGYNVGASIGIESATIRVGDSGVYSRFFAGAVRGVTTGQANAVTIMIDSNGQLGTVNSSRRYKEDIRDMGDASSGLMRLRPVTYRYQQAYADGSKPIDYGLIAEEVEAIYPDVVVHLPNGDVETVQYHKINAMMLNELQKQYRRIDDLTARLAALERLLSSEKR